MFFSVRLCSICVNNIVFRLICIVWALRASMSGWQLYIIIIIITHYLLFIYIGAVRLNFAYSYIKLCARLAAHYAPVVLVTLLNHHTLGTCLVSNPGFCSRVEFTARWTANRDRLWLGCGVRGAGTAHSSLTGNRPPYRAIKGYSKWLYHLSEGRHDSNNKATA